MKTRRIRMQTGDVFVAPFNESTAKYSDEFSGLWEPKENEECFIMQNVGMVESDMILTVLYDGVFFYNSQLKDIDVSRLKSIAIVDVFSTSMKIGSFKKISNQLIPESTPYMIYGLWWKENFHIEYHDDSGRHLKIISKDLAEDISRHGFSVTGGLMSYFANYFIKNIESEYLKKSSIERVTIRKEAAISNFFSEAKDNPNASIKLHFGKGAVLQNRESYKGSLRTI